MIVDIEYLCRERESVELAGSVWNEGETISPSFERLHRINSSCRCEQSLEIIFKMAGWSSWLERRKVEWREGKSYRLEICGVTVEGACIGMLSRDSTDIWRLNIWMYGNNVRGVWWELSIYKADKTPRVNRMRTQSSNQLIITQRANTKPLTSIACCTV